MYRRKLSRALDHREVRDLAEAVHFAEKRGKPITATLNVNPASLESYPNDLGQWTSALLNKLRIWCERAGFGYFAVWVRENYVGPRREHLHILLYVPEGQRAALEAAARRWLPGDEEAVQLGRPEFRTDRSGRQTNKALTYVLKQMTPQAWVALGREVRREKHCRRTGEPVAAVMGKRCGVSRSLNERTRQTFWTSAVGRSVDTITRSECEQSGVSFHRITPSDNREIATGFRKIWRHVGIGRALSRATSARVTPDRGPPLLGASTSEGGFRMHNSGEA